ncbi:GM16220 [Drosophila sechellia]|uniref:GM16220 n=1 Tax=Drosophila sechellia TaxID=7238 RepID=B4HXY5_DROSE|nr:GM16220 [Drosophila sechellia]
MASWKGGVATSMANGGGCSDSTWPLFRRSNWNQPSSRSHSHRCNAVVVVIAFPLSGNSTAAPLVSRLQTLADSGKIGAAAIRIRAGIHIESYIQIDIRESNESHSLADVAASVDVAAKSRRKSQHLAHTAYGTWPHSESLAKSQVQEQQQQQRHKQQQLRHQQSFPSSAAEIHSRPGAGVSVPRIRD